MKKTLTAVGLLIATTAFAQEHFNGGLFSQRTGILQAGLNPAELVNASHRWDVNVSSFSFQMASNTLSISDIPGEDNVTSILFSGDKDINGRFDAVWIGPSFSYANNDWGFGLATRVTSKIGAENIHAKVAQAIMDSEALGQAHQVVVAPANQRIGMASYGEVAASVAREIFRSTDGAHQVNVGLTAKMYMPTAYANASLAAFSGDLFQVDGHTLLTNAYADATVYYAGDIADSFKKDSHYTPFNLGKPNGAGLDFGATYRWVNPETNKQYLKVGVAIRDWGSMTYSMDNASYATYRFHITENREFNLSTLKGAETLRDIENYLLYNGFISRTSDRATEFTVKLPGTFTTYADVNIYGGLSVSALVKQKLNDDSANDQLVSQDLVQLTPRFSGKNFDVWSSWTNNEISGWNGGIGVRFGSFMIGSGSAITALTSGKEVDLYCGLQLGF